MKRTIWISLILLAVVCESAFSCVGCRTPGDSLGDPTKTVQAGLALSWSVLFLLAMVSSVLSFLGWLLLRACKQADARTNYPES